VCDLAVFPAMSKRHSELTRRHTQSVASKDVIWNAAEQVWRELALILIKLTMNGLENCPGLIQKTLKEE
jgi:hypothetical protein